MIRVVCFILESRLNIMKESKNIVGEGNREGSEKLGQGYLDMFAPFCHTRLGMPGISVND